MLLGTIRTRNILVQSAGILTVIATLLSNPTPAAAKDLTSRLGVGYTDSFSVSTLPSLAVKYYPSMDLALSASLGVDTNTTNSTAGQSNFGFGVRVYKTIFTEENLNFFMGAGGGLISIAPTSGGTGTNNSGFELAGICGVEFFFPGLDSLGFNMVTGIGITSLSSGVRFRTIGESPLKAGMFFYF
jgi:hypothetical protein